MRTARQWPAAGLGSLSSLRIKIGCSFGRFAATNRSMQVFIAASLRASARLVSGAAASASVAAIERMLGVIRVVVTGVFIVVSMFVSAAVSWSAGSIYEHGVRADKRYEFTLGSIGL